jgi:long-chain acyl-CoA synthetase
MDSHIIPLFLKNAGKFAEKEVFRFRDKQNNYQSISWNQLKSKVDTMLSSLHVLGLRKGDMVGIFSQNKPQWFMADLGIMAMGGVVVPFYATSSADQLTYMINETNMKVMFAGSDDQVKVALSIMNERSPLEKIVSFEETTIKDPRVLSFDAFLKLSQDAGVKLMAEDRIAEYKSDDLATVIYTSGTTGEPKGVMLRQDNFVYCFKIHDERLAVKTSDLSICFLPLSHVFERMWSHYLLYCGGVNFFLENPREIIEVLPVVKPTVMCAVPRFFEKTYAGIQTEMGKWPVTKQKIFKWSVAQGMEAIPYRSRNEKLPALLGIKIAIADKLVLSKLRNIFGGNIRFMPCAGAAINTDLLKFFHAMGIFVNFGYGLTETTATVSCFRDDEYTFGTCGTIMPGVEVRIGEQSEIQVKGRTVFYGYYKKETETSKVLKDGWFSTGDEGYMDDNNHLIMVDRIKDLMKTSVGKYVSPQKLELILSQDEIVEQLIVVGDNRKYVSALVVPVIDKLKELATQHNIDFADVKELFDSEKILKVVAKRFEALQKDLTSYEKVVKFTLLSEPFSIEAGTMTSTLKLRRSSIEKMYKPIVDKMYS